VTATQIIRQGETAAVPIAFDVPARPGAVVDLVRAFVSIPAEGVFETEGNATLDLIDDRPPIIAVELPGSARAGEDLILRARVDAATNVTRVSANVTLADGTALIIRRFDDRWISATRGDVSYELDRQDGNLTYASSTTKDGVTTIVIGSGRCKLAPPGR